MMFHAGGHQTVRGRSSAWSRHYPNFFGQPDWKAPLRCGILFCTFSCVLFVIGVILTWLGIHDIFGESVPITGPILLSVGSLMLLLAARQFYMAHNRKKSQKDKDKAEAATKAAVDGDEGSGTANVSNEHLKDKFNEVYKEEDEEYGRTPLMDIKIPSSPPLEPGSYIWPPLPAQSPYTSMAMMLYKNPAMMYGPFLAKQGRSVAYSPGLLTSINNGTSCTGPDVIQASSSSVVDQQQMAAVVVPSTSGDASAPLLLGVQDQQQQQQQQQQQLATLEPNSQNIQAASTTSDCVKALKSSPCQAFHKNIPDGLPAIVAKAGISNLPNRTAFMMLTTIELQETI